MQISLGNWRIDKIYCQGCRMKVCRLPNMRAERFCLYFVQIIPFVGCLYTIYLPLFNWCVIYLVLLKSYIEKYKINLISLLFCAYVIEWKHKTNFIIPVLSTFITCWYLFRVLYNHYEKINITLVYYKLETQQSRLV